MQLLVSKYSEKIKYSTIDVAASFGAFLYGILLGWSAQTQPIILDPNYPLEITKPEFSFAISMMVLGAACFCVVSGMIRSRIGTKLTIVIFAFPHFIGWMLKAFAMTPSMVNRF